jgi:ATP-dependent Lon protease
MQTRAKKRKIEPSLPDDADETDTTDETDETNKNDKNSKNLKNDDKEDEYDAEYEEDEEYNDDEDEDEYEDDFLNETDEEDDVGSLKRTHPELHQRFVRARDIMKSRELTIFDLLNCEISDDKRANLIEKYECLHNIEPYTDEYLESRDRLRSLFYKYTTEEIVPIQIKLPPPSVMFKKLTDVEIELSVFKSKIKQLTCSTHNRKVFEEKLDDFEDNTKGDEKSKIKRWLNLALTLPFDKLTSSSSSLNAVQTVQTTQSFLDKKLYGMKNVKERLILFLNKKLREGNSRGCNIALVGKPGVGKTAVAKALSECLQLPFAQVSFGGVTNPDFLMGHDYTYVGSRPGEITRCLIRMGAKNGILFFDEFDKASDKKDIMSTLLHITDFSQNNEFRDNYFPELTQDLSRVWFIYSMNELPTDPAMLDRLEVINVDEYTTEERILISNNYLIPKYTNELKIGDVITFTESGIKKVVEISSGKNHKKGVRDLERCINLVVEKVYFYLCNREVSYEYKWFKKIHSCDEQGKIKIGGEVVESILDDVKKESNNNMMYL